MSTLGSPLHIVLPAGILCAGMLLPSTGLAVLNGNHAQDCDYPSVLRLRSFRDPGNLCTASYVGGRVLITAAHCFDIVGYRIELEDLYELTGETPTHSSCQSDADCPTVNIGGEEHPLQCNFGGSCDDPDKGLSNRFTVATFGESYEPEGREHPQRSVKISYCRVHPEWVSGSENNLVDFAYCILAEEPDLQPIPMIMPCEVEAFINADHDLELAQVGFGDGGLDGASGRKRWATAQTNGVTLSGQATPIFTASFTDFTPGPAAKGDSGSPLLIKLPPPHNTWRILGVVVKSTVVVPHWPHLEWMHQDPEVVASKILPCHDVDGTWNPTAACAGFPLNPGSGAGEWSQAPLACFTPDVGGLEASCGEPFGGSPLPPGRLDPGSPDTPQATGPAQQPLPPLQGPEPEQAGCSTTPQPGAMGLLGLLGLLFLGGVQSRRRSRILGSMLLCGSALMSSGCSDDGGGSGDDELGDETGGEPSVPVVLNPELHHTHSGLWLEGAGYDQLAVGHVARIVGDLACCEDIVLAGSLDPDVELRFGGGSTEQGLTFLEDRSPQAYAMARPGEGLLDVALADLNADGRNDLLALTSGAELAVRLGRAPGEDQLYFEPVQRYPVSTGGSGTPQHMVVGRLTCDDLLDVVLTAPAGPGVVLVAQTGAGVFGAPSFVETPYEHNIDDNLNGGPADVALGDFDGEGAMDIVTVNDNGTVTILEQSGCDSGVDSVQTHEAFVHVGISCGEEAGCVTDTRSAHLSTEDLYCTTTLDDITVAWADRIASYCNPGDGFESITPNNHTLDWDINGVGKPSLSAIDGLFWWPAKSALYVLNSRRLIRLLAPNETYISDVPPQVTALNSLAIPGELVLGKHNGGTTGWWNRLVWVGREGQDTALGFSR